MPSIDLAVVMGGQAVTPDAPPHSCAFLEQAIAKLQQSHTPGALSPRQVIANGVALSQYLGEQRDHCPK